MSLFDFRRIDEFNSSGKFDPRAVLALDSGLIVVGTFDGHLEIYGRNGADEKVNFAVWSSLSGQGLEFCHNVEIEVTRTECLLNGITSIVT